MTTGWGTVYNIDCTKVEAWANAPEEGAKLVEEFLKGEDSIQIGNIVLGRIVRVEREGAVVRCYTLHEDAVALGSFQHKTKEDSHGHTA